LLAVVVEVVHDLLAVAVPVDYLPEQQV